MTTTGKLMYKTIIKIKKSTPPSKLRELTADIMGLFDNRAGSCDVLKACATPVR